MMPLVTLDVSTQYNLSLTKSPPLEDAKILALSNLKIFAGNNFNVVQMMESFHDRVENIMGKWRECWLPAFSSFPTMFL